MKRTNWPDLVLRVRSHQKDDCGVRDILTGCLLAPGDLMRDRIVTIGRSFYTVKQGENDEFYAENDQVVANFTVIAGRICALQFYGKPMSFVVDAST
jgi:hypothetical protein